MQLKGLYLGSSNLMGSLPETWSNLTSVSFLIDWLIILAHAVIVCTSFSDVGCSDLRCTLGARAALNKMFDSKLLT